jgi:hypothetical protein
MERESLACTKRVSCAHVCTCMCARARVNVSAAVCERACGADEDCMSGADEDCMSGDRLVAVCVRGHSITSS